MNEPRAGRNAADRSAIACRAFTRACTALFAAALAGCFVSCSSMDTYSSQYVGVPHFPPSDPATVEILRDEPKRPHERLGEVVIDASTDPAPPVAKIEKKLRTKAAKLGADAVVIVYDRIQPVGAIVMGGYWSRTVNTVTGRRLVGVAIKYKSN